MMKNKLGQEEMVGFALIIIVVAVILLVFLTISLRSGERETVESYEIESFIQAFLQQTTECRRTDNLEYLSIQKLIFSCNEGGFCLDGGEACDVLNSTLQEIIEESWKVGEDRPLKGRKLDIISEGVIPPLILSIREGQINLPNSKGSMQEFSRSGNSIEISFSVYY